MRLTPHRLALFVVANPGTTSFSHAMADVARQVLARRGYDVAFHDLYAEQFDPVQPTGEMANTATAVQAARLCSGWGGWRRFGFLVEKVV